MVFVISRKNVAAYKKVLNSTIDNYKQEVEILENSHKEEINKRNDAIKKHNVEPVYFDIELNKNKKFNFNISSTHNSFIYLIHGEIKIGDKSHENIKDSNLILLTKGEELKIKALTKAKFLLISGKPIGEPIARGGPFVMNTKAEILQAVNDYQEGTFVK